MPDYVAAHVNQFHDADGKPWPDTWGRDYNRLNCWAAITSIAAAWATRGAWRPAPNEVREISGDRQGGANVSDVARVLTGHGIEAHVPKGGTTVREIRRRLDTGRWFVALATDYENIPDAESCAPTFDDWHMLGLPPLPLDGKRRRPAHDPICDHMRYYEETDLWAAGRGLADFVNSPGLVVCYVRRPALPQPATDPRDARIAALADEVDRLTDRRGDLRDAIEAARAALDDVIRRNA